METLDRIQEMKNKKKTIYNSQTRAVRVKTQAEYTEANKQVKNSIRADKQKYLEDLAATAGKAVTKGNVKRMTTNKLTGKYSKPERLVMDKEGKTITETQEQKSRWEEHFEKLLNRPASLNPTNIEAAHTNLLIDVTPPKME
ncbi:unnamed protein product [Schistosoma mattheei]|uniref:Uncharacterized protein n=1 Tax=Schistosoma mattheei TaxID=31246 RepID=A0A183NUJ4_9TREM|nr:unnamed protein product [Schistosoma mattheei]